MRVGFLWVLVALVASGCGDDDSTDDSLDASVDGAVDGGPPPPPSEDCNPLAPYRDCLLPFPSDVFLQDGAVVVPAAASFVLNDAPAEMLALHTPDGFSIAAPILAPVPGGVDDSNFVAALDDLDRSTTLESPTLLLDTETGELVPHFAELDPQSAELAVQALIIRPAIPLEYERRYVVAIHDLRAQVGQFGVSEEFGALRDGTPPPDRVADLVARYDADVFAPLESVGVVRRELHLAWDFTTRSRANVTGDLLAVRDDVVARLESEPPAVVVTEVIDDPAALGELAEHIARRIEITIEVPSYMTSDLDEEVAGIGRLRRDGSGAPLAEGRNAYEATILVPKSVDEGSEPGRFLQFGHGFFGRRTEITGSFQPAFADERSMVVAAIDWWGMFAPDQGEVGNGLVVAGSDEAVTLSFIERIMQGMANQLALAYAARTTLLDLPELQRGDGSPIFEGGGEIFYGISQGHILGGTYTAISPFVRRAVLGSGGANFSMMMYRSIAFGAFRLLIDVSIESPIDRQKFAALLQLTMDRVDPLTYAPYLLSDPPDGAPDDRQVLIQTGLADSSVPTIAAHLHARALGIPHLQPAPRTIWGVPAMDGPLPSAIVEADFGYEPNPRPETFPPNEVHEEVRRTPALQEQIDRFLMEGGLVEHTCDGVCDPE